MDETRQDTGGLLATGRRILRSLHCLAHARLDLFLVELQEERVRLFGALLLIGACLEFAFMALALLTATVVVIFWEQHRILVMVSLTGIYAAGAGWLYWRIRRQLAAWQSFPSTLEQFKKDQTCLENQS
jgi:uncharacterized membrane protein YqjE